MVWYNQRLYDILPGSNNCHNWLRHRSRWCSSGSKFVTDLPIAAHLNAGVILVVTVYR